MSINPCSRKIILLYRDLLRYGKHLQLTDKDYYMSQVKKEFRKNKSLENPEDIEFQYKVSTFYSGWTTSQAYCHLYILIYYQLFYFQKGITLLKNRRIL